MQMWGCFWKAVPGWKGSVPVLNSVYDAAAPLGGQGVRRCARQESRPQAAREATRSGAVQPGEFALKSSI